MSVLLGVNIDHCATLRQARYRHSKRACVQMVEPDPVALALAAEHAGADGITVHLREDLRHIQEHDVERLRESLNTRLNLEMAATPERIAHARSAQPDSVCIVPENREEITTEGGFDLISYTTCAREVVVAMREAGITTSFFINPEQAQIEKAAELGSPCIELHAGAFANQFYDRHAREQELEKLRRGAAYAHSLGLTVNAGHGINYINIAILSCVPHLHELNIGHSLISRALYTGIEAAVREMKAQMTTALS